jgi:outer membrane protein assembly factor BamB
MRTALQGLAVVTAVALLAPVAAADDWPQWLGPQRDSIWRETGILAKFPEKGPKVLWRAKVGTGYSGPAVAKGKVYVTDFITEGNPRVDNPMAVSDLKGKERVLCFDAKTGEQVWKYEYDCHYRISYPAGPRCQPTVHDGKVYTVGAMGDLYCLDAAKGTLVWSKSFTKDYKAKTPIWGFAGHPLVDGQRLICIVGGPDAVAVAFDKDTGKELWKSLSAKEPGYSSPVMVEGGGKKQVVIWHAESINGLNPETGEKYWSEPMTAFAGMAIMVPRQSGDYLFAGGLMNSGMLLKLTKDKPGAEVVWRGKKDTAVYPVNMTPFIDKGTIYGVDTESQLRGVKLENGERLWETMEATLGDKKGRAGTAFIVKNGDRYFLASETGHLIIAKLSPEKYEEVSRWQMLKPTGLAFGRDVLWVHPAFADKCVFWRNDEELVCASLAAE